MNWRVGTCRVMVFGCAAIIGSAQSDALAVTAGMSPDTSANHVDANTVDSPFGGVGAVLRKGSGDTFSLNGTGTLIGRNHILTAAHLVDLNNDGTPDVNASDLRFQLNLGGNATHSLRVGSYTIAPGFTGLGSGANFNPHDDIAVFTLLDAAPIEAPIYRLYADPIALGSQFDMVGYGYSWVNTPSGIQSGSIVDGNANVKRFGSNSLDMIDNDDDGALNKPELFRYDYDHPSKGNGTLGGPSLGASVETVHLPGDSGGPIFLQTAFGYEIAGVMNYIGTGLPSHGSQAGGNVVTSYLPFIQEVMVPEPTMLAPLALLVLGLRRNRAR